MTHKKLNEVALPLEVINCESAREKSIRYGHCSTLHLWWVRPPLGLGKAAVSVSLYGPRTQADLFASRQLVVLSSAGQRACRSFPRYPRYGRPS